MTLDEAIIYYGMLARQNSIEAAYYDNLDKYSQERREDAERYSQLYHWLSELREYRSKEEIT